MDAHVTTHLIQAAAAATAATRLSLLNSGQRFSATLAYLVFLAVANLGYGLLDQASAIYFWSYLALAPLKWIFSVLAVREVLTLTFDNYPGIRTGGRWALYTGVTFALSVSLLMTGFFWRGAASGRAHSHLFYFEVSERSIVFTLALVITAILLFLSNYPLHLSRNTLITSAFFSILFLSEAARLLLDSLAPQLNNHAVDWAESAVISLCLFGWAAMLRPEKPTVPTQIRFSNPREDHLLQQLNALNQLMSRAARR
jgi:hypothetical protein